MSGGGAYNLMNLFCFREDGPITQGLISGGEGGGGGGGV